MTMNNIVQFFQNLQPSFTNDLVKISEGYESYIYSNSDYKEIDKIDINNILENFKKIRINIKNIAIDYYGKIEENFKNNKNNLEKYFQYLESEKVDINDIFSNFEFYLNIDNFKKILFYFSIILLFLPFIKVILLLPKAILFLSFLIFFSMDIESLYCIVKKFFLDNIIMDNKDNFSFIIKLTNYFRDKNNTIQTDFKDKNNTIEITKDIIISKKIKNIEFFSPINDIDSDSNIIPFFQFNLKKKLSNSLGFDNKENVIELEIFNKKYIDESQIAANEDIIDKNTENQYFKKLIKSIIIFKTITFVMFKRIFSSISVYFQKENIIETILSFIFFVVLFVFNIRFFRFLNKRIINNKWKALSSSSNRIDIADYINYRKNIK